MLYGPQESHPVQVDVLDCENPASQSYWQPAAAAGVDPGNRLSSRRVGDEVDGHRLGQRATSSGGESMAAGPGGTGSSEERTVSYQPEERYWTDYLRIALPVVGLLLLIGLLWYWASAIIGDRGSQPPQTPELAIVNTPPVSASTPAPPTATAVVIVPTQGPPPEPTATPMPPVAVATDAPAPTAAPAAAATETENPCASLPVYAVGDLVQTTEQVNLRESPTTDSASIKVLPVGDQLQITGEFSEAGQCDWWPVTETESGISGYVIEQYLRPVSG
jgi:hypothetical protein